MTRASLSFFDPADPDFWTGWAFEFYRQGRPLTALPPTVGLTGDLGTEDPWEYDRAPGSGVWRRYGDGLARTRPTLALGGTHLYRSDAEALEHTADVEASLAQADALYWRGRWVCDLDTAVPGTVRTSTGANFRETTFALSLNPLTPVTRQTLALVQR